MSARHKVAVLFVARGGVGGLAAADAFADAVRLHEAGHHHRLVLLAKRWQCASERRQLDAIAAACGAEIFDLPDDGLDWGAYFRATALVNEPWLCLMNSHSRPLVSGWLALLMSAATRPGFGLVGATGSWESPRWTRFPGDSALTSLRGVASALKHGPYMSQFAPFPNPHVRSTGVVVSHALFSSFTIAHQVPRSKHAALMLESGRNGLSTFAMRCGLALGVVGRDGRVSVPLEWPHSGTFRIPGQPALLISDNRTRDYETADAELRRSLEIRAWGRESASQAVRTAF